MGDDEAALVRLWQEKRGEIEPEDLSGNLIVQLGLGHRGPQSALVRGQYRAGDRRYPAAGASSGAALDGGHPGWPGRGQRCRVRGQVHAALVVLGGGGSRRSTCRSCSTICAVVGPRSAVLSVITGGGKWVEITAQADPLYQHLIVTAERKFWRCVETGEPPQLFGVEPPKPGSRRSALST